MTTAYLHRLTALPVAFVLAVSLITSAASALSPGAPAPLPAASVAAATPTPIAPPSLVPTPTTTPFAATLPASVATPVIAPVGSAVPVKAAPVGPALVGHDHLWIPSLKLSQKVYTWGCAFGVLPPRVYIWTCAGNNDLYLFGHNNSVFLPIKAYYAAHHRMPAGATLSYANHAGVVTTYRVAWIKVVLNSSLTGSNSGIVYDDLATPSVTTHTCYGSADQYRLIIRWEIVK